MKARNYKARASQLGNVVFISFYFTSQPPGFHSSRRHGCIRWISYIPVQLPVRVFSPLAFSPLKQKYLHSVELDVTKLFFADREAKFPKFVALEQFFKQRVRYGFTPPGISKQKLEKAS